MKTEVGEGEGTNQEVIEVSKVDCYLLMRGQSRIHLKFDSNTQLSTKRPVPSEAVAKTACL